MIVTISGTIVIARRLAYEKDLEPPVVIHPVPHVLIKSISWCVWGRVCKHPLGDFGRQSDVVV